MLPKTLDKFSDNSGGSTQHKFKGNKYLFNEGDAELLPISIIYKVIQASDVSWSPNRNFPGVDVFG